MNSYCKCLAVPGTPDFREVQSQEKLIEVISVLVSLIKHLHFVRLEIVTTCEHASRITRAIPVARQLDVRMAQVAVRIRVGACRIGDVNVVSATECWTIAAVPIYGVVRVFNMKLEGFQSIMILKREDEAVG